MSWYRLNYPLPVSSNLYILQVFALLLLTHNIPDINSTKIEICVASIKESNQVFNFLEMSLTTNFC